MRVAKDTQAVAEAEAGVELGAWCDLQVGVKMAEGKESFSRVSEASLKQCRRAPRPREQSFST